ncbi:MAG: hypothetical protein AB7K04_06985 [Pseudorhodoplanes sp.]
MIRKTILALSAIVAMGAAALAPTSASAGWHKGWHGHHHHWGHGFRVGFYTPYVYGGSCYTVKKFVGTPYGPKLRRVTVCD